MCKQLHIYNTIHILTQTNNKLYNFVRQARLINVSLVVLVRISLDLKLSVILKNNVQFIPDVSQ